jgi:inhibitor of KinA sporulation pathway (predicted exonuclease)
MLFVGIDGEMSCPDMEKGGKLIQIGLSVMTATGIDTISLYIRPPADMYWEDRAAEVHQITQEQLKGAPHPEEVDETLYEWLIKKGANPKRRIKTIPVGFNITGFDMPFIKMTLPKTYSLFSKRTAELNGMLWLLHGKQGKTMEQWKTMSMEYAKMNMDTYKPHDAGWDSARHLLCYEYLRTAVAD